MKKIGIITFHNSYNCGSMLESYAMLKTLEKIDSDTEIINFSNKGQKKLYSVFFENNSVKNIIKNLIILPHSFKIRRNNIEYEKFKNRNFKLSKKYLENSELVDDDYSIVVAGSDQIWNITIDDFDDAYFLNWVSNAKKVAYAPSFGAKNITKYSNNVDKYKEFINNFDALSVRELNGKKWIKEMTDRNAELLIDPTLLLSQEEYNLIVDDTCTPKEDYIFFYCPGFKRELCEFVKEISKKYKLPVIVWSTKSYYTKSIFTFGFKLPKYESPSIYLSLIKNAKLVFTTSFHGTIFSTIYRKNFYTLKNGEMYGEDDRVITLLKQIGMENRLVEPVIDQNKNYLESIDYNDYEEKICELKAKANNYITQNIGEYYEKCK